MRKTTGEASLWLKIKFDMLNIYLSWNVDKRVKFRGKSMLEVKLLGLLT